MTQHTTEIAIIGAGVIGLTIAEALLAEGTRSRWWTPATPAWGPATANAGTIADYAVSPVGTPDVLRNLPALLFDRNSPLAIRRAALPSLAPWLLRFARQSLPGPAARNAQAIAALLAGAGPLWEALALRVSGAGILQHRGCLYLYETPAQRRAAEAEMTRRRALGVSVEILDAQVWPRWNPACRRWRGRPSFRRRCS